MASYELTLLSASEQSRLIRDRKLSPVELMQASLARIERWDPMLRAYITVCGDAAMNAARVAEREIAAGRWRGPLHGLPFGVKDQLNTRDVLTTLGSKVLANNVPDHDATVIHRLKAAGAILIGKENLHEFGKGGTVDFPYGQPRNPWNPAHNPAGSSSGTGGIMYGWTADTIGPLTRTVEDNALFLKAIAGHDPQDPLSSTRPVPDYAATLNDGVRGMKLGVVRELSWPDGANVEVIAAMREAIRVFESLGATVREVSLARAKYAVPLQLLTSDSDIATMMLRKWLRTHWSDLDVGTRTRLAAGCLIPAAVYHRAMRGRALVRREVLDVLGGVDALICPTNLHPPGLIEAVKETVDSEEAMEKKVLLRRISTYPFSMANIPALALPMGFTKTGLPISLQIAAKPFAETTVFRIAQSYEESTAWHAQHPNLSKLDSGARHS